MPAAEWTWQLRSGANRVLGEVTTGAGWRLSAKRNSFMELSTTVSIDDEIASLVTTELRTGWPRLVAYRRPAAASSASMIFNGHLGPLVEQAGSDGLMTMTARSPFARLIGQGSEAGFPLVSTYTTGLIDAAGIAVALAMSMSPPYSIGIQEGTHETTVLRSLVYETGQNIGEAIVNLAGMLDGFDFVETPIEDPVNLVRFDTVARQGTDRPNARFEYGDGTLANLEGIERATVPPCNYVLLQGANGMTSLAVDNASILTYGPWPLKRAYSSISVQATLDARAAGLLRPRPIRTVQITPGPKAPKAIDDFSMGDTIAVYADRGSLQVNVTGRVNAFDIVVDANGFENASIPDPQSSEDEEAQLRARVDIEEIQT